MPTKFIPIFFFPLCAFHSANTLKNIAYPQGGCASQLENLRCMKYLQVSHSHYCFAGLRSSSSCIGAFIIQSTLQTPNRRFIVFNKIYRCHCSVGEKKGVTPPSNSGRVDVMPLLVQSDVFLI